MQKLDVKLHEMKKLYRETRAHNADDLVKLISALQTLMAWKDLSLLADDPSCETRRRRAEAVDKSILDILEK